MYKKYLKYKKKYLQLKNMKGGNVKTKENSLVIKDNFYSKTDFNKILKYIKNNNLIHKSDSRVLSRKTICLSNQNKHKELYQLVFNDKLNALVEKLIGKKFIKPSFPIEYRIYPEGSTGMGWHQDLALYKNDYYEGVLTLENTSDCMFEYQENGKTFSLKPKVNTLALVKPNANLHRVTKLNKGFRTILKFVVIFDNNKPNKEFYKELEKCPN